MWKAKAEKGSKLRQLKLLIIPSIAFGNFAVPFQGLHERLICQELRGGIRNCARLFLAADSLDLQLDRR